jgi:8-oxo-dGTP diphosphatase
MPKKKSPTTSPPARAPAPSATPGRGSDAERVFLEGYRLDEYERPSVAVDIVVLTVADGGLQVGLYERDSHPDLGLLALPGGFMRMDESLDEAARRLLTTKAGLHGVFLEQLYTFSEPGRDPRGRIVTVSYVALVDAERFFAAAMLRRKVSVPWPGETGGAVDVIDDAGRECELAFDHASILGTAVKRLRGKLDYTPVGFQLLPPEFTLRQLQDIHEAVRGEAVNKDSFRRRMLASGHLEATGNHERNVTWRPAELYRFVRRSAV